MDSNPNKEIVGKTIQKFHDSKLEALMRSKVLLFISGIGCDTISFDAGNALTFPAHRIFLTENIYGLENVKNLGKCVV